MPTFAEKNPKTFLSVSHGKPRRLQRLHLSTGQVVSPNPAGSGSNLAAVCKDRAVVIKALCL